MAIAAAAIIAGGALAGSAIASSGASRAQRSAAAQRDAAYGRARGLISGLSGRGAGFLRDAFGDRLNPEAFLYEKVDLTQSQLDTIAGNIKAFPSALELTNMVNPSIWINDIGRIRTMMPQFDRARDSYIGTTRRLQEGKLPFDDVMDIYSRSAERAGGSGAPGGHRNATLRDLGLSRLDAMNQGNSMFAQFMNIAQSISPVEHQMRPQQMFFTPQERAQLDIEQAALEQQGRASAEMARAMPDPATNALVNAQMGIEMAALGQSYAPTSGAGAMMMGQGLAQAAAMFGQAYGSRNSNPWQYGGGGQWAQQAPISYYGAPPWGYGGQPAQVEMTPAPYSQFDPNQSLPGGSGGAEWPWFNSPT